MRTRRKMFGVVAVAALVALVEPAALAAAPGAATVVTTGTAPSVRHSRASLHLDVGRPSAWVGQTIPITVRAQFRDVDGVTLEGAPELVSDGVFTSNLAREPRQSTVVVDGEPMLVATWSGTVTPSTAGPLALSVQLPVHLRYHEAAAPPTFADPGEVDPFALLNSLNIDPGDPSSVQRLFHSFEQSFSQSFEQPMGRAHDETTTLKAVSHPLEIRSLPAGGQPRGFSGAVGKFDVRASLPAEDVRASQPTTLSITVQGDGDLDRVDLPGVQNSTDWKAYPVTAKVEAAVPGKKLARKTFEQVLIPLHGGSLMVPAIALSAFDPLAGRYTTVETVPLTVDVDGPPSPVVSAAPAIPAAPATIPAAPSEPLATTLPPPSPGAVVVTPRTLALRFIPVLAIVLASIVLALWRRRDDEKALRRALRLAAKQGSGPAFFDAARKLIVVHFAKRWGVAEKDVTPEALRKQLGTAADPLVAAISTADALRFGRGDLEPSELRVVCSSIESSLRDAA